MAYGTKYTLTLAARDGHRYRVRLARWGYEGASVDVRGMADGVTLTTGTAGLSGILEALHPSTLDVELFAPPIYDRPATHDLTDLATHDTAAWQAVLEREDGEEWATEFVGYVAPGTLSEAQIHRAGPLRVVATEGYAEMGRHVTPSVPGDILLGQQYMGLRYYASPRRALGYAPVVDDTTLTTCLHLYPYCDPDPLNVQSPPITGDPIFALRVLRRYWAAASGGPGVSEREASERVASALGVTVFQSEGRWYAVARGALAVDADVYVGGTSGAPTSPGTASEVFDLDAADLLRYAGIARTEQIGRDTMPSVSSVGAAHAFAPDLANVVWNASFAINGADGSAAKAFGWTFTATGSGGLVTSERTAIATVAGTFGGAGTSGDPDVTQALDPDERAYYFRATRASIAAQVLAVQETPIVLPGGEGEALTVRARIVTARYGGTSSLVNARCAVARVTMRSPSGDDLHTLETDYPFTYVQPSTGRTQRLGFLTSGAVPTGALSGVSGAVTGTLIARRGTVLTGLIVSGGPGTVRLAEDLRVGMHTVLIDAVDVDPTSVGIPYWKPVTGGTAPAPAAAYEGVGVETTTRPTLLQTGIGQREETRDELLADAVPLIDPTGAPVTGRPVFSLHLVPAGSEGTDFYVLLSGVQVQPSTVRGRLTYSAHALGAAGGALSLPAVALAEGPLPESDSALLSGSAIVPLPLLPGVLGGWRPRPQVTGDAPSGVGLAAARAMDTLSQLRTMGGATGRAPVEVTLGLVLYDGAPRLRAHHVLAFADGRVLGLPPGPVRVARSRIAWRVASGRVTWQGSPLGYDGALGEDGYEWPAAYTLTTSTT